MDILDKAEDALKNALLSIPFIKRSVDYVQSIPTHMVRIVGLFFTHRFLDHQILFSFR